MSIKVMNWVWENSTETGTALLMLLAIADHANDDGVCWPSVARLSQRARVGERQAQNLIKQLELSGAIEVQRGIGRNHTSVYVVKGAADCTISDTEKVQRIAPIKQRKGAIQREKVQSSVIKGEIAIAPDPLEPPIEPSVSIDAAQPKEPTPNGVMFERLCFILFAHTNTKDGLTGKQRGLLNSEVKRLQKVGASPDDLAGWYKQEWRKNWPGNEGQTPRVEQVIAGVTAWVERKNGKRAPLDDLPAISTNGNGYAMPKFEGSER